MDDNLDLSLSLFTRAPPSYRPLLPPPPTTADHQSAAIDASTVDTTLSLRSTAHTYSHHDNNYDFLPSTSLADADVNGVSMNGIDDGTLPLISLLGCSASASEYMAISPRPTPLPQPPPPYQDMNALFMTLETWPLMGQTASCFSSFYCMHPEASRDFQLVNTEPATNLAFIGNSTTNKYCNGSVADVDNEATSASPS